MDCHGFFETDFIFVLGADEYLERLEGKIRNCLFFYVKICDYLLTIDNDFNSHLFLPLPKKKDLLLYASL